MLIVGMTGGIGSGKSTVAGMFDALGAEIIDTDRIAHTLTSPGAPALDEIAAALGRHFLTGQGTLDRAALRQLVFSQPQAKKVLEDILHPRIREAVQARLAVPSEHPYRILVVPLLFETEGYAKQVDRTLLVDCSVELQIARAMARSSLSENEVRAIIASQMPRQEKLARVNDIIVNDSTLDNLRIRVLEKHEKYISLA